MDEETPDLEWVELPDTEKADAKNDDDDVMLDLEDDDDDSFDMEAAMARAQKELKPMESVYLSQFMSPFRDHATGMISIGGRRDETIIDKQCAIEPFADCKFSLGYPFNVHSFHVKKKYGLLILFKQRKEGNFVRFRCEETTLNLIKEVKDENGEVTHIELMFVTDPIQESQVKQHKNEIGVSLKINLKVTVTGKIERMWFYESGSRDIEEHTRKFTYNFYGYNWNNECDFSLMFVFVDPYVKQEKPVSPLKKKEEEEDDLY